MTDPVAWDLAERVAGRVAGREPLAESYLYDSLQPDFDEFTAQAEVLVAEVTGLRSPTGPARGRVTDRAGWVGANISSFQRLLRP
ncbi:MAG: zinc-dependent metalloprotease, partial [Anaerolineales bacterium]